MGDVIRGIPGTRFMMAVDIQAVIFQRRRRDRGIRSSICRFQCHSGASGTGKSASRRKLAALMTVGEGRRDTRPLEPRKKHRGLARAAVYQPDKCWAAADVPKPPRAHLGEVSQLRDSLVRNARIRTGNVLLLNLPRTTVTPWCLQSVLSTCPIDCARSFGQNKALPRNPR